MKTCWQCQHLLIAPRLPVGMLEKCKYCREGKPRPVVRAKAQGNTVFMTIATLIVIAILISIAL